MADELEFVRRLQKRFPPNGIVQRGIGDDGAVLDVTRHGRQVIVTDMLLDGVHFDLATTSPALAGRKAIAVNLSDLAAMGCYPDTAFISIAVPKSSAADDTFLEKLYTGIESLAKEFSFVIAGGDTNAWNGPFAINVCMTGTPFANEPVLRSGAMPGDHIYVTGALGGSLNSGRHLTFIPRLDVAEWLMENTQPSAMMDISDGLSIDLHRILEASHCGAIIHAQKIPIHSDVPADLNSDRQLQHALSDGEDFELLLTLSPTQLKSLQPAIADRRLINIGIITDAARQFRLHDHSGNQTDIIATGWQHL